MKAESEPEFSTLPWKGQGQARKPNICSWLEVLTPAIHNRGLKPQEKVKLPSSCLGHCHWSCILPRGMQVWGKHQWKFNFTFLSKIHFSLRCKFYYTLMNSKNYFNNTSLCNTDEFLKVQTASEKTRFGVKPGVRDGGLQQMKSRYYSSAFPSVFFSLTFWQINSWVLQLRRIKYDLKELHSQFS